MVLFNPLYPAELLKWTCPASNFGTVHYQYWEYQDENLKLVNQQYRIWSDCVAVQASLALYWWQRIITFGLRQCILAFIN